MSTMRLTFLYPHLFRGAALYEPVSRAAVAAAQSQGSTSSHRHNQRGGRRSRHPASFHPFTTTTRAKEAVFERHGKAVEPLPEPQDPAKLPQPKQSAPGSKTATPAASKGGEQPKKSKKKKNGNGTAGGNGAVAEEARPAQDAQPEEDAQASEGQLRSTDISTSPGAGTSQQQQQAATEAMIQREGPMEAVLHMPPPQSHSSSPPHISTPPYVHHFDSWSLVKLLEEGGYTQGQAIIAMKAVRTLLRQNLDVAQEGLVSKSDVDNETYLFNAACSELSAEVTNNHRVADEQTRQQRTVLQHEADMLSQRMSQDLATLRDDVKAMFHDRKMSVREEQRTMDSAIQQINLKISVLLNSDAKSDIEGLRWILIRRSVLGILFMAVLTLGTLRYATYVSHERQREAEEKRRHQEHLRMNGGKEDHAPPVDAAQILAAN